MKKLLLALALLLSVNAFSQLAKVSDFKTYKGDAPFLYVSDTLQGGFFVPYLGPQAEDGGMIFNDGKGGKYKRKTEGPKVYLRWYGLKPGKNSGPTDDAEIVRKVISFIKANPHEYDIIQADICLNDQWYYLASTVYLDNITLEGVGSVKNPKTLFQVKHDVTAFRLPASSPGVTVRNVAVRHYANAERTTDSNNHSFDIHSVFVFENVKVISNPNGNGFNVDACGYASPSDTVHFGNADQSRLSDCFADECINGLYINGCDANVISIMDFSGSSNYSWAVKDQGLLGNKYWNPHFANNGKGTEHKNVGARIKIPPYSDTSYRTWFLREDVGPASIGKRPDLHPELWYQNAMGLGGNTWWDSTKQYYTGGGIMATNPNANNLIIGAYTESHSPANIIGPRSYWMEGLNGADIIGGMYQHTFMNSTFFTGAAIQSNVIASPVLRMQGDNGTEKDFDINSFNPNGAPSTGITIGQLNAAIANVQAQINNLPQGSSNQAQVNAIQTMVSSLDAIVATKASKDEVKVISDALAALTVRINNLPTGGSTPNPQLTQILADLQNIINRLNALPK